MRACMRRIRALYAKDVFVVNGNFGVKIPEGYPLAAAGPVMCAGVTMYDPLSVNKAENGTRVGIVGLGGGGRLFPRHSTKALKPR